MAARSTSTRSSGESGGGTNAGISNSGSGGASSTDSSGVSSTDSSGVSSADSSSGVSSTGLSQKSSGIPKFISEQGVGGGVVGVGGGVSPAGVITTPVSLVPSLSGSKASPQYWRSQLQLVV